MLPPPPHRCRRKHRNFHPSLAAVIGLGDTHSADEQGNEQLGGRETVAAILENGTLMGVLRKVLVTCE
ncbi:MIP18 family [Pyrenophora seminiperda CCB06]|uniref:MIP18 family n=1 Tax=Pyrenophora seminiperda CCB06 TaxID=1302712 RepID=A0A3M7LXL3_9PLEO|nr:MIP18 family [Pyrenophora seminiperda CCB06]